ncbi:CCCH-type Zn-finger protein [Plasmopara halstedii]|uniref:CCCH-type Zn-finger protein n=1 Tax=Plasmopara halstedii TaxID=4781 RepID=A0A0P1B0Z1_PLAHL|nr:CCCH-type Zn-finger protein [Plasmopara halstedii]CEG48342.1 CCCH-type Zn-finger protein [Plasmopara halstedii]|eukprot:XP_024584711.1 CCCH-type Zn-finger protein [Plasmopara halstedii]
MLLSSMDHLGYYSMSKDSEFIKLESSAGVTGPDGFSLPSEDIGAASYINEENSPKNITKSSLYKTELCKRFSEFGNCRYGAKCQFAHGIAELRHVVRHPKYKTTKCKSYWGSGHCPYGSRCRFIHEETEGYSQPPFSPSSQLGGGIFLHEKNHLSGHSVGIMAPPPPSVELTYSGGLYSEQHTPQLLRQLRSHHHMMSSYAKDTCSLLSSFDRSTSWGASIMNAPSTLHSNYSGERYNSKQQELGSIGAPHENQRAVPVTNTCKSTSSPSYPDLQDAIDALMKFSLTSEDEPISDPATHSETSVQQGRRLSSVSSPALASTSTVSATSNSEFSLQSDELWKDFPTASSAPFTADDLQCQSWSTGLQSLSLDNKAFDSVAATSGGVKNASSCSSDDEDSPRLSVFERFH